MTREEFIGVAADAILRDQWGVDPADPESDPQYALLAVELAKAALDAVGAWDLREALRTIVTMDGGGSFRNLTGMNAELAMTALSKAERS